MNPKKNYKVFLESNFLLVFPRKILNFTLDFIVLDNVICCYFLSPKGILILIWFLKYTQTKNPMGMQEKKVC